jgi:hypothetical protein
MSLLNDASLILVPSAIKTGEVLVQKPLPNKFADETGNYDGNDPQGSANLTFTRASTATRVNSSGLIETVASNVPRLDYLGSSCPRLLLEPQRTNVVFPSNASSNWSALGGTTVTPNATTSPEGTANATAMYETNTTSNFVLYKDFTVATGAVSIYAIVKTNGRNIQLGDLGGGGSENARFNLVDGTVIAQNTSNNAYIESYGNGWYKVGFSMTKSGTLLRPGLYTLDYETSSSTHVGDSTKGIFIYHVQGEQASYSTSVIPTTTATVTRLADACSKTGISSLIGQTEGTLFAEFTPTSDLNADVIQLLADTAGDNVVSIGCGGGYIYGVVFTDPNYRFSPTMVQTIPNNTFKVALCYKNNDFTFFVNGVKVASGANSYSPLAPLTRINFNEAFLFGNQVINYKSVLVFPVKLSDADAIALTA